MNANSKGGALSRFTLMKFAAAVLLIFAGGLVPGCVSQGLALEPTTPLGNYGRQSWVMENGLPQNTVHALAQTRDGFVWLGTEAGLVRFDGAAFKVFDRNSIPSLPGSDIRCLLQTPDGALWIGTGDGLARWKNGAATVFTRAQGLPADGVRSLSWDADGIIEAWTDQGRAEFRDDRFLAVGDESLDAPMHVALPDSHREMIATGSPNAVVITLRGSTETVARLTAGKQLPGTRIQVLVADREGALWIGTNGGLARWSAGKVQTLPVTDPLAAASVLAVMEDREGNVWVGTETDGLHILRDQRFHTLGTREGLSSNATTTVVEDAAGTLWVGTGGNGLNALGSDGRVRVHTVKDGLQSDVILSLAPGPRDEVWVGTPDGLNRIRGGHIDRYSSSDGLPDDFIRSLLADADGSLWIGTRRGLVHWVNADRGSGLPMRIETSTQANGLGSDLVGAMARDSNGDLWVATLAGLSRLDASRIESFSAADGLSSNVVTTLLPQEHGTLLIGSQDHGLDRWDGRKFSAASGSGSKETTIRAILDDGRGHLWFATGDGIARCDEKALGAGHGGTACANWIGFGAADGLRSREMASNSHPSAWRARDGHLWFASPKGLVEVDPAHFSVNTLPPPVELERFSVDDLDQALRAADFRLKVPAGRVHFEFEYAGLSFVAPQKVRYRYMLEGFDHEWTDAGPRRTAYYTNIPPGKYTFRVQAANNDGIWNTTGASVGFELEPHFYQTVWFYALLLAIMASGVVLLVKQRLRHAEGEFKAVLGERSRIAREIHDTLAQGYVGISAHLEVLAELLRTRKLDESARQLDLTRSYVRAGLADARQSIWALRTQDSRETTLPVRLRRIVEAGGNGGVEAEFSVFGAYRPLPPGTELELLRVGQEAIHNVKKHAGAKHLLVQLEYGPESIALEVRDDGRGGVMTGEPPSGHYGLTGMRERAAAIGGHLEVTSAPGEGTAVRLSAPAPRVTREQTGDTH